MTPQALVRCRVSGASSSGSSRADSPLNSDLYEEPSSSETRKRVGEDPERQESAGPDAANDDGQAPTEILRDVSGDQSAHLGEDLGSASRNCRSDNTSQRSLKHAASGGSSRPLIPLLVVQGVELTIAPQLPMIVPTVAACAVRPLPFCR